MPFSYVTRSGDGDTTSFTFSFTGQDEGYIREEDIVVLVDGASVPFVLTSSNTLETDAAPPSGTGNVIIRRVMPKDLTYGDFRTGNNFGQEILNNSFLQSLYVIQEVLDGWFPEDFRFLTEVKFGEGLDLEGQDIDNVGNLDAQTLTIDGQNIEDILPELSPSSFSPISWHDQVVDSPVNIPENKNAWSFGPTVQLDATVTVGEGSYWTVAEGEITGGGGGDGDFDGNFDYGEL